MACSAVCSTICWYCQMAQQFRWNACSRPGAGPRVQMMIIDGPVHETRPTAPKTRRETLQKVSMNSYIIQIVYVYSPNSVSTLRGSYDRGQGRCLIEVLTLASHHFSGKFSHKGARGSKIVLTCPYAFRLRSPAQRLVPDLGLRHFAWKFLRKWLLRYDEAHSDCTCSYKVWVVALGSVLLLLNITTGSGW